MSRNTNRAALEQLLRAIPQYSDVVVTFRRGQGYFARTGSQTLYFQTFATGKRFCEQVAATGRGNMADLRVR